MTSPLLREACAGIGTRIKSPITAKHAGKGQEVERQKRIYACEGACMLVCVLAFIFLFYCFFFPLVCLVFVSVQYLFWGFFLLFLSVFTFLCDSFRVVCSTVLPVSLNILGNSVCLYVHQYPGFGPYLVFVLE